MKVVLIGGTGHIGTYLTPRLWEAGYEVIVITRGRQAPYQTHPAWREVQQVVIDRSQVEAEGGFGERIASLHPDVVVDLIAFTVESTRPLVEALRGKVQHFLHCGTIWSKGYLTVAPMQEDTPSEPYGDYGIHKQAIEKYLLDEARRGDFPATVIHPGHITGPGYAVVNPVGNHNPVIFTRLAHGETLPIPNFGMETLHHVHGDDVAQMFFNAMQNWSVSIGEAFFAVSEAAVTLRGYAVEAARWFGQPARLDFMPWEAWKLACDLPPNDIESTYAHIAHGQCGSIAKAQRLLDYQPRYTSFEAVREAVDSMINRGLITLPAPA